MQLPPSCYALKTGSHPNTEMQAIHQAIMRVTQPVCLADANGLPGLCPTDAIIRSNGPEINSEPCSLMAYAPPLLPENLGNPEFKTRYGIKYPYIAGAMAHGISSVELVKAAGNSGMIGFFGSAGLPLADLEKAVFRLKSEASGIPYGLNLVFSGAPEQELATVNLYLKHGLRLISAAGYLKLTLPLLYYRISGIYKDSDGRVVCPNKIIAKTSRLEIARQFLSPAPDKMIRQLVERDLISENEAMLAQYVPVAEDLTAEADSGGHTDNRAAISLLPSMIDLRDELYEFHNYSTIPCIGLAGGIATPKSVAAAFAMGADYVLTGSINQACIESGTSPSARRMLANAMQTDVIMAPSANMFERGIKVQVLKRGSLFPQRAARLYDIYQRYGHIDDIPQDVKSEIEGKIFQNTLESEWEMTRDFFETYDPVQLGLAETDPRRRMALIFRSYLGKSSKWAINDVAERKKDYQIWCGPAMGAFNEWVKGSFLEDPDNRNFETVAMNLLYGSCVVVRRQYIVQGLAQGMSTNKRDKIILLPPHIGKFSPLPLTKIRELLKNNDD